MAGLKLLLGKYGAAPALAGLLLWTTIGGASEFPKLPPDGATLVTRAPKRIQVGAGMEAAQMTPPDGASVYLNETDPIFFGDVRASSFVEELTLFENVAPLEIISVEFGIDVSVAVPLRIVVRFWNVLNPASTPVNSGLLGSETIDFGTTPVAPEYLIIAEQLTTPIILGDPNIAVQFEFRNSVTSSLLSGEATLMFAGGGPLVGSSPDWYFRDVNSNGQFDPTDKRTFLGNPGLANFQVHLRGLDNPSAIDPGIDLYETPTNGATFQSFTAEAGLFDACSPGAGYGSLGFTQDIPLKHKTLVTEPPDVLGNTDTIVRRNDLGFVNNPGDIATSQVEIVALSLQSSTPVTINYNNGTTTIPTLWDVFMCLSNVPQTTGSMTITRGQCTDEGGTFQVTSLPILPKFIFSKRGAPACSVTVDQGVRLQPPTNFSFSGRWLNLDPENLDLIQEPVGNIVQADANCDGVFDAELAATTDTFHPGLRVLRCTGVSCGTPATAATSRRVTATAAGAQHMMIATLFPGADADTDGVPDVSDNCGGVAPQAVVNRVANATQVDADDDGYGNACDNCVSACNPDQVNTDGDAFGDLCDCNVSDPTNPKPAEATNLRVEANKQTWTWNTLALSTGYNVLRGTLPALPVGPGGGEEICFTTATPTVVDAATPATSAGYWYLARGTGVCGAGTYGKQGVRGVPGVERVSTTCP